jgi:hypothetical protein
VSELSHKIFLWLSGKNIAIFIATIIKKKVEEKMPSKSKDVRIEQRRTLEKKLDLRLQKLTQKGISKEKSQSDPLVKELKAKIKKTNLRINVLEKYVRRTQELVQAKLDKVAAQAEKKKSPEPAPAADEPKPKKRSAAAKDGETKKKPTAAADAEPKKQARKKKEEPKEE